MNYSCLVKCTFTWKLLNLFLDLRIWGQKHFFYPFEGQTKLLLSRKLVYIWFEIHLHVIKIVLFFWIKLTRDNLNQWGWRSYFLRRYCKQAQLTSNHLTCWTNVNKAVNQHFKSGYQINDCWRLVNNAKMQWIGIF